MPNNAIIITLIIEIAVQSPALHQSGPAIVVNDIIIGINNIQLEYIKTNKKTSSKEEVLYVLVRTLMSLTNTNNNINTITMASQTPTM